MTSKKDDDQSEITNESVVLPTSSPGVVIEVCNPQVKDDTFNKYVAYTVKGTDKNGSFEVVRRYSDFDKIRALLLSRWPGCYIPPLPPKALNSLEAKVVRERRKYLNRFCQKIAEIPHLHYFDAYQEFIRSKNPNIEKALAPFSKVDYEEIINRYASTFSQLAEKEYNIGIVRGIVDFKTFLKKIQGQVDTYRKFARQMTKAKNSFYQEFASFNNLVAMQYDKVVLSELHGGDETLNIFYGPKGANLYQHAEKVEEGSKRPSLEYIEEWIKAEAREVEAFLEAIEQKDTYETLKTKAQSKQKSESEDLQKVMDGKTTMKGLFLRKSKDEEKTDIEKQIAKHSKDFDDLTKLADMIVLVLAYVEIDKFKSCKLTPYYNVVRIAAQNELSALLNMEEYWKLILENKNIEALGEN